MFRARALIAFTVLAVAAAAHGQESSPAEFGRVFGGELSATMKQPNRFSGSIGFTAGRSSLPFASQSAIATFGGTALKDKVWFFGAAETSRSVPAFAYQPAMPRFVGSASMSSQLGDNKTLSGSFVPRSFLSLHYTGILSSNSFFSASVTSDKR